MVTISISHGFLHQEHKASIIEEIKASREIDLNIVCVFALLASMYLLLTCFYVIGYITMTLKLSTNMITTMVDKIPWDTCVIALIFSVFKTEF